MEQENRIVVLIDMDCFYCQVEEKLNPELQGKPVAVVQYNPWKGGGIIAVNYEARAKGVTRHMRGDEAKEKCPDIYLPSVPCLRGKADTSKYREAGKEVAKVLQKFTSLLERASVDEAYLDITLPVKQRMNTLDINTISIDSVPNTFALGYDSIQHFIDDVHKYGNECIDYDVEHSKELLVGAVIVKHLGGKFGDQVCGVLNISKMGELQKFTEKQLQAKFDDKNGTWLYNIARGIDNEPVQARFNSKSIGCCKQLRGKSALGDLDSLKNWLKDLSEEIEDRLEKDSVEINRVPKQMVVSFTAQFHDGRDVNSSRSYNFISEDEICPEFMASKALEMILDSTELIKPKADESNRKLKTLIKFLAISVGKFEEKDDGKKTRKISEFLLPGTSKTMVKNIESLTKDSGKIEYSSDKIERSGDNTKGKQLLFEKFFQGFDKESETTKLIQKDGYKDFGKLAKPHETIAQASLHKQELFFQRFLNGSVNKIGTCNDDNPGRHIEKTNENIDPIELEHNLAHDNGSNDSDYSGSTINDEINKSVSLFKDEPFETDRISNMRNMLRSSVHIEQDNSVETTRVLEKDEGTVCCPDCKKNILLTDLETHSDYHVALKLREDERKSRYLQKELKINKTCRTDIGSHSKIVSDGNSITNFFIKFDTNVPLETCSECRRKIPLEKFTEHLDFHEAQKLNRELNRKTNNIVPKENIIRKRKSTSPDKEQKVPRRTIESFFTNI
ncbi:DNA polymerase eta [Eumeta japonica]|uniref:DNA polymerase eta n=1 Tax=Eumeta variegata TaxID=151549 RepID=A0A4C1XRM1_EUMVA|nr:DNA polymerase eta [Eumeta japonica]